MIPRTISLGRMIADCGAIHPTGRYVAGGWDITLRDDRGAVVAKARLRGAELGRIGDLLDRALVALDSGPAVSPPGLVPELGQGVPS